MPTRALRWTKTTVEKVTRERQHRKFLFGNNIRERNDRRDRVTSRATHASNPFSISLTPISVQNRISAGRKQEECAPATFAHSSSFLPPPHSTASFSPADSSLFVSHPSTHSLSLSLSLLTTSCLSPLSPSITVFSPSHPPVIGPLPLVFFFSFPSHSVASLVTPISINFTSYI